MITGKKRKRKRSEKELNDIRSRLKALATLHGIKTMKLAMLMGEYLENSTIQEVNVPTVVSTKVRRMPSLDLLSES